MNDKVKYLTYPIAINQRIISTLSGTSEHMLSILWYGIRKYSLSLEGSGEFEKFDKALDFFNLAPGSKRIAFNLGKQIEADFANEKVFVSVNRDIVLDFARNEKTEFEVACFLGYSATKSILGSKPYMKITNDYFLSRIFGYASTDDFAVGCTEPAVYPKYEIFANRYMLDKIKEELKENWGLKLYGRYTRGFYISYKLTYSELVCHAELLRKSRKVKKRKEEEARVLKSVLEFIETK